jgi:hypothetical protein
MPTDPNEALQERPRRRRYDAAFKRSLVEALRCLPFDSSDLPSWSEKSNDVTVGGEILEASVDSPESSSRSSLSAPMDNCGDPSDIAPHVEASHIQDGNSRDMPDGVSTWTTAPTPRPMRRYRVSR